MATHKILVIDDDESIGELISFAAEGLGLPCTVTSTAEAFFEHLDDDVTLIVLDLVMPTTDGIELLRTLGERHCKAGIVLMSGTGKRVMDTAETLAAAHGLSITGHLAKPFSIVALEQMLQRSPTPHQNLRGRRLAVLDRDRASILRALSQSEFVVYYQPQIEIATGRCIGVEALVRWQHPTVGLVPPGDFISAVEDLGLMQELTCYVIERGLAEMGHVRDRDGNALSLSFNLSTSILYRLAFPDELMERAARHNVPAEQIILEVTETGLIQELTQALDVLTRLRLKGVRLSVDDFGTGYAMLDQLRLVPANELKIDRSLVSGRTGPDQQVMLRKIIEMSRELQMVSVAEGVETEEQLDLLRQNGCDIAQGYLFSPGLPRGQFVAWLSRHEAQLAYSSAKVA